MVQITHTEILTLAISAIEAKIARWRPDPDQHDQQIDELTKQILLPLHEKCETLKALYKVETGTDFGE